MRKTVTYIDNYRWKLTVYSCFGCEYTDSILRELRDIGCGEDFLERARDNMGACIYNTGLAFTNSDTHESLVVVYRTTTFGQLVNTLSHEISHVCGHISQVMGIDPYGEEFCSLIGDLMEKQSDLLWQH